MFIYFVYGKKEGLNLSKRFKPSFNKFSCKQVPIEFLYF